MDIKLFFVRGISSKVQNVVYSLLYFASSGDFLYDLHPFGIEKDDFLDPFELVHDL